VKEGIKIAAIFILVCLAILGLIENAAGTVTFLIIFVIPGYLIIDFVTSWWKAGHSKA